MQWRPTRRVATTTTNNTNRCNNNPCVGKEYTMLRTTWRATYLTILRAQMKKSNYYTLKKTAEYCTSMSQCWWTAPRQQHEQLAQVTAENIGGRCIAGTTKAAPRALPANNCRKATPPSWGHAGCHKVTTSSEIRTLLETAYSCGHNKMPANQCFSATRATWWSSRRDYWATATWHPTPFAS